MTSALAGTAAAEATANAMAINVVRMNFSSQGCQPTKIGLGANVHASNVPIKNIYPIQKVKAWKNAKL
jgi:hypothetical protein